jgi:hypothetical protein
MSADSQSTRGGFDGVVRQYEYDEQTVLVADFGPSDGTVDVVDGTAVVVVDDQQYEFEVPDGADRGIINNGVLTIEVER